MPESRPPVEHTLQCMEIWGGIEPVERAVSTPGLDLWVFSQPFEGDAQGGDVYYVTLCGGGIITRIVVADVSGHGSSVAEFSLSLRSLLRKNINQKSQKRLVERLNRQFTEMAALRRFATALVVTYLASTNRLTVCNAGHPHPLLYSAATGDLVATFATCRRRRSRRQSAPWARRGNALSDVRSGAGTWGPRGVLHRRSHRGRR